MLFTFTTYTHKTFTFTFFAEEVIHATVEKVCTKETPPQLSSTNFSVIIITAAVLV